MSNRKIKVAALQTITTPGKSREEKVEHLLPIIRKASEEGNQIIMPPELYTTDYEKFYVKDIEFFKEAEPVPGPSTEAVGEITKEFGNYVITTIFEKKAPGIYYNTAATVGPDGTVVSNYRKVQVASVQVLEKLYFRRGNYFEVQETVDETKAKFGITICHDRRYPETSRILAILGAEIMFCPTAAPGYAGGVHWSLINRARSVDNGMFCVYSNRIGTEWEKVYFGESMIVDPKGEVIAFGEKKEDAIVSAELNLDMVDEARIAVPTLRDLRNDLYRKYYKKPVYDELL